VAAAQKALDRNSDDVKQRIARGIELAQRCSWESTVQTMQSLIADAIGKPHRRSKRSIAPLEQAALEYIHAATQGS
jgi:hypothetical protein